MAYDQTVVIARRFAYPGDGYLVSADGGLLDFFSEAATAQAFGQWVADQNRDGLKITGNNPKMEPGYNYGRLHFGAIYGPNLPTHLQPHTYSDLIGLPDAPDRPWYPGIVE